MTSPLVRSRLSRPAQPSPACQGKARVAFAIVCLAEGKGKESPSATSSFSSHAASCLCHFPSLACSRLEPQPGLTYSTCRS